jgi:hypothetical protein
MIDQLKSLARQFGFGVPKSSDPKTQAYIDFNRAKWKQTGSESNGVVLVGLFSDRPAIHCYSYITNYLARRTGGVIRTFYFQKGNVPDTVAVFDSFGAQAGPSFASVSPEDRERAERQTEEIVRGLKTKWDAINITIDGVMLGDLIVDTYIRYLAKPTVALDDPDLRATIRDAVLIYYACRDYLATHKVTAVLTDHTVYTQCGVLVRLATIERIPVYIISYGPKFLVRQLDYQLQRGERLIQTLWPYYNFRKLFAELPPDEQERARERGRQGITERLSGKVDSRILTGISAYDAHGGAAPLLKQTGRPRVLVLLHDFCDAAHLYRSMLFPDFMEWSTYILERASKTPFDWYAKPHPNNRLRSRAAMNAANDRAVAELKERFPAVTFLPPSASNRHLVDEGIASMFTVHGTAAHEFAYMGVPVVNSGENPHWTYTFNLHAKSLEELDQFIANAGHLTCDLAKPQIDEFFYMYYTYMREHGGSATHPIDPNLISQQELADRSASSDVFDDFIRSATPERDAAIERYLDQAIPR